MPVAKDEHAKLSPSSSSRWLNCPGSLKAIEGIPDSAGFPAAEGTCYHHRMENVIETGVEPESFLGQTFTVSGFDIKVDEFMVEALIDGYAALEKVIGEDPHTSFLLGTLQVELRVNLESFLGPNQFGTSDIVFVSGTRLIVLDWKYGRIVVQPVDNTQLAIYGIGALNSLDNPSQIETVDIYVYQPRDSSEPLKVWETDPKHLRKLEAEFRQGAIATMQGDAVRVAGEKQCQYCAARPDCFEHAKWLFETNKFDTLYDCEPERLTTEQLVQLFERRTHITRYLGAVEDRLTDLAAGGKVPGYIVAEGRKGNRMYPDEELARDLLVSILGDDAYVKRLLTPAEATRALDGEFVNGFTDRPDGKLKLKKE